MADQDDIQIYRKRRILHRAVILVFLVLLGRLYQLQLIYREEYGKKSEENSVRVIPKEPVRGYIYDRNGILVVDNRPSFTVTIMPFEFDKRRIGFLSSILQLPTTVIRDRLRNGEVYSRFAPVKIKRDISFRELSLSKRIETAFPGSIIRWNPRGSTPLKRAQPIC